MVVTGAVTMEMGGIGGSGGLMREAHESACRPCFVECEAGAVFLCVCLVKAVAAAN